jgi:hypothetical protein
MDFRSCLFLWAAGTPSQSWLAADGKETILPGKKNAGWLTEEDSDKLCFSGYSIRLI